MFFCNKTINGNNKKQEGGGVRVGAYLSLSGRGWGGVGLGTYSRLGAY